jgi:Zn-dependent peptidase ImmA (M78 family)
VIVHELTHYLQGQHDELLPFPITVAEYTEYLQRRSEQEAFFTAAYFFTRKSNPTKLREVMESSKTLQNKTDELLNYHFRAIGFKVIWKLAQENINPPYRLS